MLPNIPISRTLLTQMQRQACDRAVLAIIEARHQVEKALLGFPTDIPETAVHHDLEAARTRLAVWEGIIEDHLKDDEGMRDAA